jgi:class 3 adenylate cyclase
MTWVEILTNEAEENLSTKWDERAGNVVPESDTVTLKDGAVKVDATFLYADLAGSSKLAKLCPWETTAKIIRSYLSCSVRLIRAYGGEIRSFDGDRVMGVFMGNFKNTYAVKCAREIDWVVEKIINPNAREKFKSVRDNNISIRHCVGVDTGEAVAVRAGIRDNNDLIWVGRPPSLAAKLSDIREYPFAVYISEACYKAIGGNTQMVDGKNIWEARNYQFVEDTLLIYRTSHMLTP